MVITEFTTIPKDFRISVKSVESSFGPLVLGFSAYGLCYLGLGSCQHDLRKRFVGAVVQESDSSEEHHSTDLSSIERLCLIGTPFQRSVWRALLDVDRGHLTTYSALATRIGSPRAVRAVGSAVGRNPISIIVPCHRVVRLDGALGGYYWGEDIKGRLLTSEQITL